ncbi:septum site-determining protein Ssd [Luteococcus sp. OSA5]|uniref:septum site-determining protein Ssd n=1 Tax=Luteococcus sp. OSA5 TaxID=3401630 RepID=UPI003B42B4AC
MNSVVTAPLVVAKDPRTIESVLAACASAGVEPEVVHDPVQVRATWRTAACVVVAVEMAARVCGLALESRPRVHLVGSDMAELAAWSALLEASILVLPQQDSALTQVLAQTTSEGGQASVVWLAGGSGGLGVSTLCCALAQQASQRGQRAAVVELDPDGGGLDLLFGAETAPGWRWADLRSAVGHIERLDGNLPNVSGVDIVAHGRRAGGANGAGDDLPVDAVRSVLACLERTHDLVVVDSGVGATAVDGWPGQRQLLVVGGDVRSVMAARSRRQRLGWHDLELVVRTGPGRALDPHLVAEGLATPMLGRIGHHRSVIRDAARGAPPGRGRGGYARQVSELVQQVVAS